MFWVCRRSRKRAARGERALSEVLLVVAFGRLNGCEKKYVLDESIVGHKRAGASSDDVVAANRA